MNSKSILKRSSTLVANTRVSEQTLAELHEYWVRNGEEINSISELIRLSVEGLRYILESNNLTMPFVEASKARNYLLQNGLGNACMRKKEHKHKKLYLKQVDIESAIKRKDLPDDFDNQAAKANYELEKLLSRNKGREEVLISDKFKEMNKPNKPNEGDLRDESLATIPNDVKGEE